MLKKVLLKTDSLPELKCLGVGIGSKNKTKFGEGEA